MRAREGDKEAAPVAADVIASTMNDVGPLLAYQKISPSDERSEGSAGFAEIGFGSCTARRYASDYEKKSLWNGAPIEHHF
jgi:hypothetical protein